MIRKMLRDLKRIMKVNNTQSWNLSNNKSWKVHEKITKSNKLVNRLNHHHRGMKIREISMRSKKWITCLKLRLITGKVRASSIWILVLMQTNMTTNYSRNMHPFKCKTRTIRQYLKPNLKTILTVLSATSFLRVRTTNILVVWTRTFLLEVMFPMDWKHLSFSAHQLLRGTTSRNKIAVIKNITWQSLLASTVNSKHFCSHWTIQTGRVSDQTVMQQVVQWVSISIVSWPSSTRNYIQSIWSCKRIWHSTRKLMAASVYQRVFHWIHRPMHLKQKGDLKTTRRPNLSLILAQLTLELRAVSSVL